MQAEKHRVNHLTTMIKDLANQGGMNLECSKVLWTLTTSTLLSCWCKFPSWKNSHYLKPNLNQKDRKDTRRVFPQTLMFYLVQHHPNHLLAKLLQTTNLGMKFDLKRQVIDFTWKRSSHRRGNLLTILHQRHLNNYLRMRRHRLKIFPP